MKRRGHTHCICTYVPPHPVALGCSLHHHIIAVHHCMFRMRISHIARSLYPCVYVTICITHPTRERLQALPTDGRSGPWPDLQRSCQRDHGRARAHEPLPLPGCGFGVGLRPDRADQRLLPSCVSAFAPSCANRRAPHCLIVAHTTHIHVTTT